MPTVIRQNWEESERGWGVRPDGYSLHKTQDDLTKFVKEYWDNMPSIAPEEYERPCGKPYEVEISEEQFNMIDGYGQRFYK